MGVPGITLDIAWGRLEFEVGIFGGHKIAPTFQGREKNGEFQVSVIFQTVKSLKPFLDPGLVYWS